jgi:hypothetical protein
MMTSLLSMWDGMIRAYRDSHMPNSWVVCIFGILFMACVLRGICIC